MNMTRKYLPKWIAVSAISAATGLVAIQAHDVDRERFLYVWAGDQARVAPDFLAVIDFDRESKHYGRVIKTRDLPDPGATGNEPHHVGL